MDSYSPVDHVFDSFGAFRDGSRRESDRVGFLAHLLGLRGRSSTASNVKGPLNFISCKKTNEKKK